MRNLRVDHPAATWLTTWASGVINKFHVHADGRTSYELMTGHRCNHLIIGFGEKIWFKLAKGDKHDYDTDWDEGYFLGVVTHTTKMQVGNAEGIYQCTTVRRLP